MGNRIGLALLISFLVIPLLWGCQGGGESPGGTVLLRVTRDFGQREVFSAHVEVSPGESALEALKQHLDVETDYGGRFISAIENLASRRERGVQHDWFFYTNGITAGVGAGDYYPREGDVIWWDYHPWGDMYFTPAVTGAFPQPFTGGYRGENPGTVILFTPAAGEPAAKMGDFLRESGAKQVRLEPYGDHDLAHRKEITMVVALWHELAGEPFWQGMLENRARVGWFAGLDAGGFTALDFEGGDGVTYTSHAGAILASGQGLGDPTPLWLITALDEASLSTAVDRVTGEPGLLEATFGALVAGKDVIKLPLQEGENNAGL